MQTGIGEPLRTYAPQIFGALHDVSDTGMASFNGKKWWSDSLLILTVSTTRQPKLIFENSHETRRADAQADKVYSPEELVARIQQGEVNVSD